MAKKFLDYDGLAYVFTKVKSMLSGKADTGHTHDAATTSAAGFMSAADKTKLDGIETGATAEAVFVATYRTTTLAELQNAYNAGKHIFVKYTVGSTTEYYALQSYSANVFKFTGMYEDNGGFIFQITCDNGTWSNTATGVSSWDDTDASIASHNSSSSAHSDIRTLISSHNQAASTITAGTLAGQVNANATAAATVGTAQVRDIYAGTDDMTAGTTALTTGAVYFVYE